MKEKTVMLTDVQKILDALPFYVMLVDEQHHILLANRAVQSDLGITAEEIVGKYCPLVVHGENKPYPHCPLEASVKENRPIELNFYDNKKNKWFSSAIYPTGYKTGNGQSIYFHMVRDISEQKKAEEGIKMTLAKLQKAMDAGIQTIIRLTETRDPFTAGHQLHVSKLASRIAREMSLSEEQIEGVRVAGLLHDIGKIAVPIEILSKPGTINVHEMNIIKIHSEVGFNILKEMEFPWPIADIILQHHERLNGTGYPSGLSGDDIILEARILSVADVVEAMSSHRPYRPALGIDEALKEILHNKGVLYDPAVVEACMSVFKKGFTFE